MMVFHSFHLLFLAMSRKDTSAKIYIDWDQQGYGWVRVCQENYIVLMFVDTVIIINVVCLLLQLLSK